MVLSQRWKHLACFLLLQHLYSPGCNARSGWPPEVWQLQKDIVTDPAQLALNFESGSAQPNFLSHLSEAGNVAMGTMVTKKFSTIEELKRIRPVVEVEGVIVGRPFTLEEAAMLTGKAVLEKIFGPGLMRDTIQTSPPQRRESLLIGKLTDQFRTKGELQEKLGSGFLSRNAVSEVAGEIIGRDRDIKFGEKVDDPSGVLRRLEQFPPIVHGEVLSGNLARGDTISNLPNPRSNFATGGVVASARTRREVDEQLRELGIAASEVQEVAAVGF